MPDFFQLAEREKERLGERDLTTEGFDLVMVCFDLASKVADEGKGIWIMVSEEGFRLNNTGRAERKGLSFSLRKPS